MITSTWDTSRGHSTPRHPIIFKPAQRHFPLVAPQESFAFGICARRTCKDDSTLTENNAKSASALAAFDPQGLVFAVATGSKYLRLYDARNWERGAFSTFELSPSSNSNNSTVSWSNLQFSPDGKEILITLNSSSEPSSTSGIILDSFDGIVKGSLESSSPIPTLISYPSLQIQSTFSGHVQLTVNWIFGMQRRGNWSWTGLKGLIGILSGPWLLILNLPC